ncbi:MAG: nucleotidyltransferase family protein [Burkholderiaceae bacterium]
MSDLIGVLPAAGRGSRLGPIPSSKEVMPLGFDPDHPVAEGQGGWRPFTTIEAHLDGFKQAGIEKVVVILGSNKQDIMEYLGGGARYGLSISYLFQEELRGMPFALDLANPWSQGATTVFTMPDTLIEPNNSTARLLQSHQKAGADLSLGLFETNNPSKFGMVELDSDNRIVRFDDKPRRTNLHLMWGLAAWSPVFASFMHERLERIAKGGKETVLSDIFAEALKAGLHVQGVELRGATYNDIGTPEEFQLVVRKLALRAAGEDVDSDEVSATPRLTVVRGGR